MTHGGLQSCPRALLTPLALHWTLLLTPDVKQAETTGKKGGKNPPPGIKQQLQPGFTLPGVFVLKSCKLQMVEREERKKKTLPGGLRAPNPSLKRHIDPKAAIQSNGSIIAVL